MKKSKLKKLIAKEVRIVVFQILINRYEEELGNNFGEKFELMANVEFAQSRNNES